MQELAQNAIRAALESDWLKAKSLNLQILKNDPYDIDALNRLSKAYFELGKTHKAIACCKKVLKLDDLNVIASKNLEKFALLKVDSQNGHKQINPNIFLEQPGRTRLVELIHISETILTSALDPGTQVRVHTGGFRVSIFSLNGQYIGKLTDDISKTVIQNTQKRGQYHGWIKDCQPGKITVFLKQTNS